MRRCRAASWRCVYAPTQFHGLSQLCAALRSCAEVNESKIIGLFTCIVSSPTSGIVQAGLPHTQVSLPVWGRLDEQCGWREFAAGAAAEPVATAVTAFEPQSVLGVDWHALGAWRSVRQRLGSGAAALPYIYLNYRCVFATQSALGTASSTALSAACMAQPLQPMLHCLPSSKATCAWCRNKYHTTAPCYSLDRGVLAALQRVLPHSRRGGARAAEAAGAGSSGGSRGDRLPQPQRRGIHPGAPAAWTGRSPAAGGQCMAISRVSFPSRSQRLAGIREQIMCWDGGACQQLPSTHVA